MYQWKAGSHHKVKADVAGRVCESLEKQGRLSAAELLETAKDERSPIHVEFEWNDTKAAQGFRLQQARMIINTLTIQISSKEKQPVRAFFNIIQQEPTYTSIQTIINDSDSYQLLLKQAYKELTEFKNKYKQLTELGKIINDIEEIEKESLEATA